MMGFLNYAIQLLFSHFFFFKCNFKIKLGRMCTGLWWTVFNVDSSQLLGPRGRERKLINFLELQAWVCVPIGPPASLHTTTRLSQGRRGIRRLQSKSVLPRWHVAGEKGQVTGEVRAGGLLFGSEQSPPLSHSPGLGHESRSLLRPLKLHFAL